MLVQKGYSLIVIRVSAKQVKTYHFKSFNISKPTRLINRLPIDNSFEVSGDSNGVSLNDASVSVSSPTLTTTAAVAGFVGPKVDPHLIEVGFIRFPIE